MVRPAVRRRRRSIPVNVEAHDWCDLAVRVYAGMVEDRMHFAQASYRDGEWYCMLGHRGRNINGERYNAELGEALRETLIHPVGQWCIFWWEHPIGARVRRDALAWIERHRPPVRWIPDRPIGKAVELGKAAPFFAACRTRRVVLVGPAHMERLVLFPVAQHIQVPDATASKQIDRVVAEVRAAVQPDDLVLFAAGLGAAVMIHRLWPDLRGRATLMDIGASLDPYCGEMSRGVYRYPGWQENVMPRNVP